MPVISDALDQREVAALLAAVDHGQMDLGHAPAVAGEAELALYDFRRPERVSKEHLRALDVVHEGFARSLGASLSSFMRTIVDVRVVSVEQCAYGEFILALPNPTCFYLLGAKPMNGNLILEISPSIVFPMLDRLLGGGREPPLIPERPVTDIEQRLVDRLVERALKSLAEAWGAIQPIELAVLQKESNPQLIQVLPQGEVVVLVAVDITVGEANGRMNLCLPFALIEPVMNHILRAGRMDYLQQEVASENALTIARVLTRAPVELTAYLAETSITVADLMRLAPGDILKTEKAADGTLQIAVEGQAKFRARAAQHRGRKAVVIAANAGPHDRI